MDNSLDTQIYTGNEAHPLIELTQAYLESNILKQKTKIADEIARYGLATGRALAAVAHIDLLGRFPRMPLQDKQNLYDKAERYTNFAIHTANIDDDTASAAVKARILKADLPLYYALLVDDRYPTSQEVDTALFDNTNALVFAFKALKNQSKIKNGLYNHTYDSIIGSITETTIKNLINYFSYTELQDGGFFAIGSLYSEDNSRVTNPKSMPWDISAYSTYNPNGAFSPVFKIQAKTKRNFPERKIKDTHLVTPNDIALDEKPVTNKRLGMHQINGLLNGDVTSKKQISDWSDKLLENLEN